MDCHSIRFGNDPQIFTKVRNKGPQSDAAIFLSFRSNRLFQNKFNPFRL